MELVWGVDIALGRNDWYNDEVRIADNTQIKYSSKVVLWEVVSCGEMCPLLTPISTTGENSLLTKLLLEMLCCHLNLQFELPLCLWNKQTNIFQNSFSNLERKIAKSHHFFEKSVANALRHPTTSVSFSSRFCDFNNPTVICWKKPTIYFICGQCLSAK